MRRRARLEHSATSVTASRVGVAQLVLVLVGEGNALGVKLGQRPAMKPEPVDAVQAELFAKLEERAKEDVLQRTWRAWSLGAHLSEWLLLATAPGGDVEKTKTDPVLSEARTPRLYEVYIEMLFIGLSDNTTLESFVSLYKTFAHCNMDEMAMDNLFQYHSGLAGERAALCAPEMRSEGGGALRPKAKEQHAKGKPLPHPWRSKKQLRQLCRLTRVRASSISKARYFARGKASLSAMHKTVVAARRAEVDEREEKKIASLRATMPAKPAQD
mmetsp:Transcript_38102/g.126205  ORF Transcript_38102/g.126205 Transcript_38102/m.126205 type:complete len:271 (+) Transcript_38102:401-1213(+)